MRKAWGRFAKYFKRRQKRTRQVYAKDTKESSPTKTSRKATKHVGDAEYRREFKQTPNASGYHKPKRIILHHSDGYFSGDISWCLNQDSEVSYHYVIAQDGQQAQLCADNRIAWHAYGCNTGSIGIAFTGNTVTGSKRTSRDLTDDEVKSCVSLIRELEGKYGKLEIKTHQEVDRRGWKVDCSKEAKKQILASL